MPWRGATYEGEFPSLGPEIVAWIETYLCHGPGDVQGSPIELDDELFEFVVRCYRLDPETGKRVYRRAFLSRAKGRAKSEVAGMMACAEALGPVRFAGWDAAGEPVGRPVTDPFVRCLATEEGQSGNTFANVATMLDHLKNSEHGREFPVIDLGRSSQTSTRILLSGGGQVVPSTASGAAKDGGKETFAVFDEALSLDTPLPTPSGWTTMGDVSPGEWLLGSSGQPVEVTKTTPVQADRLCYRVSFADGTSVVTSDGHLWRSRVCSSAAQSRVRTTGEMAADGRRFRIPRTPAAKLADVPVPIDPYVLGYWLGNGDATNGTVSVGRADVDAIAAELIARGQQASRCTTSEGKAALLYLPGLVTRLRHQGLLRNKHVPALYLRASAEQRTELLRGLMDSDGHAGKNGHCTFTQADPDLTDSVRELLRSLGQVVTGRFDADTRSRYDGTHRIWFTPHHLAPFSLYRKASRVRGEAKRGPEWVTITSIEPVASVPVRCVAVDAEDHLFVAGQSWKLTHNTHLYMLPELHRMHATVRRNLRKRLAAEPWCLETSTMYSPGEESVAEATHTYAQAISEGKAREAGLLFDHRQAPAETDLSEPESLKNGLRAAYGPFAEHMDLDGICAEIWDPQSDPNESRRYWLNQPTASSDAWLSPQQVEACASATDVVTDGEAITLGFDGSRQRQHSVTDSTALVGCRVSDGHLFLIPYGDGYACWEQPQGPAGKDWEVPTERVSEAVAGAFERYKVLGFYADPARWESYVDDWTATYGNGLLIRATRRQPLQWWFTGGRSNQIVEATSRLHAAIVGGECSLDAGSVPLLRHLVNARRRVSASGVQIAKEHPMSTKKIDAAVAALLAWRARGDAVAAGFGNVSRRNKYRRKAVGF